MLTSLVMGGEGFIGSHVAKHCADLGHHVVVLDDLRGDFWRWRTDDARGWNRANSGVRAANGGTGEVNLREHRSRAENLSELEATART